MSWTVPGDPLYSATAPSAPTGARTRFGMVCPAVKFRFEARGRGEPEAYPVMNPPAVGAVTVTFSTTADTPVAGTPPCPVTLTATVAPARTAAGGFGSVAPLRVLDTRSGTGAPAAAVRAGATVAVKVTGQGAVPATGVSAVVLNVTVTAPTAAGFITGHASGSPLPLASNLNFTAGQTVPNLVVAPVGADGAVALYNGSPGTVQLVADLSGYYLTGPPVAAGAVWAWGYGGDGELGNGNTADSAVPVPVSGLRDVTRVAAGAYTAYGLRSDGTVWSWGYGSDGELGNGHTTSSTVPVPVSDLADVTAIAAGTYTGYALRRDGTVWSW